MLHSFKCNDNLLGKPFYIRFVILIFVILLVGIHNDGFGQNNDQVEERVREIRLLYNEVINETKTFEKKVFSNAQTVYLSENKIVRIKTENDKETIYDFYYDRNEDLFFAFSQDADGTENRYYFSMEENGLLNLRIPILIKWLDSEKKPVASSDERFKNKRLDIFRESKMVQEEVKQMLHLGELPYKEKEEKYRELVLKAERIDSLNKDLIESIDVLEDDDENEFCVENIHKYSAEGEPNMICQVYYESCDPGCMVITESKKTEYYTDNGELFLTIIDNLTSAYSDEFILFDMNRVEVIKRAYILHHKEMDIYTKRSLMINDYLVY